MPSRAPGSKDPALYPRLRAGIVLRRRVGTAFRQGADLCAVGRGGKVYELESDSYAFLKACDGRSTLDRLRSRFSSLFDKKTSQRRLAAELGSDPTLSDLLELRAAPAPADPRQVVETKGLKAACRVAVWHLVSGCNLSCAHCYLGDNSRGRPFDARSVRAAAANLHAIGVEGVRLTGGETTIRPRLLLDAGEELERLCLPFSVNSNAVGDVGVLAELFGRHPDYARFVQVSVDGSQGGHDAMRGRQGAFRRTLENIGRLLDARVPVCVVSMMHRGWLGGEEELFDALRGAGVQSWTVELPVRSGRWSENGVRLGLDPSGIESMCRSLIALWRRSPKAFRLFEINQIFRRPAPKGELSKSASSPACLHHLGLLTFGERGLSFCSVFGRAFGPALTEFTRADCGRRDFFAAWNRIASARLEHTLAGNAACAACELWKDCQGGCPGHYEDPAAFTGCDPHARLLTQVRRSLR